VVVVGSTVYAATYGGLSISNDGGATFTNRTVADGLGSEEFPMISSVFVQGRTVYATTLLGLGVSTDGGATFRTRSSEHGLANNSALRVKVFGSKVYVSTTGGLSISN
jgi:hypothetical protein